VLLEGVPKGIVLDHVRASLCAHAAVVDVHDLHVWALASSTPALSAHVVLSGDADADAVRRELADRLQERHGIDHVTLQAETDHCGDACAAGPAGSKHDHPGHHGHVHH